MFQELLAHLVQFVEARAMFRRGFHYRCSQLLFSRTPAEMHPVIPWVLFVFYVDQITEFLGQLLEVRQSFFDSCVQSSIE